VELHANLRQLAASALGPSPSRPIPLHVVASRGEGSLGRHNCDRDAKRGPTCKEDLRRVNLPSAATISAKTPTTRPHLRLPRRQHPASLMATRPAPPARGGRFPATTFFGTPGFAHVIFIDEWYIHIDLKLSVAGRLVVLCTLSYILDRHLSFGFRKVMHVCCYQVLKMYVLYVYMRVLRSFCCWFT
jgi:hypothetical protein